MAQTNYGKPTLMPGTYEDGRARKITFGSKIGNKKPNYMLIVGDDKDAIAEKIYAALNAEHYAFVCARGPRAVLA